MFSLKFYGEITDAMVFHHVAMSMQRQQQGLHQFRRWVVAEFAKNGFGYIL